jgi:hypothetical protein
MNRTLSLAFVLATAASVAVAAPVSPSSEARQWLSLVDKGDYDQSWRRGGDILKARVAEDAWTRDIDPVRRPLGTVVSRKLAGEQKTRTLPGAPAGDYDIVKFDTQFANRQGAAETVVLAREPGGWKVNGYFIR